MTHDLLVMIWRGTLISSAAICLVLALRLPMRRWFGAQAAYLLWALVPCALLAAMLPAPEHPLATVLQVVPAAFTIAPNGAPIAMAAAPALDRQAWLLGIWCIGASALLAMLVWQQRRYLRALGRLVADNDGALRSRGHAGSPALVGALRPRIVLPHDFDSRFDARERELVLAHERAHLARGDAQINALIALLRCLNWFNPLFHFAASLLRFDQELACDAHVINRFPEARRPYADAMLKAQLVGEARQELRLPIGCYWPSTHPLKERIAMLKSPNLSPGRRVLASASVALLALSVGYASWASQPGVDAVSSRDTPPTENITYRMAYPPHYPAEAVRNGISGKVMLKVHVDEAGAPESAQVVSIEPTTAAVLADAAIASAMQWHYNPAMKGGRPEGGDLLVPVDFSLADMDGSPMAAAPASTIQAASYRKLRPPSYPAEAIAERVTGTLWVRAHVNAEGAVTNAQIEDVYPAAAHILSDTAMSTVSTWTFNPATQAGTPIESDVLVPLEFSIAGYQPAAVEDAPPVLSANLAKLEKIRVTGRINCDKDCPPPVPTPAAAKVSRPLLPPQPINTTSVTPALFDIFPPEDQC